MFGSFNPFDLNRDGRVDGIDCMIFNEIINKTEDDESNDDQNEENDGIYATYGR